VLIPQIEAFKSHGEVLGLPAGSVFDIQVIDDALPNPPNTTASTAE
jgi:hypothetical protein